MDERTSEFERDNRRHVNEQAVDRVREGEGGVCDSSAAMRVRIVRDVFSISLSCFSIFCLSARSRRTDDWRKSTSTEEEGREGRGGEEGAGTGIGGRGRDVDMILSF